MAVHRRKRSERDGDGISLGNPHIQDMEEDFLYHLNLGSKSHNLSEMFGDVRFVCMGGTEDRMKGFAQFMVEQLGYKLPTGTGLVDISQHNRYAVYKIGPILSISHGMGTPSISILLHEVVKLLYHSGVKDPVFFRIGTCGGLGLTPGSVVVTGEALNDLGKAEYRMVINGNEVVRYPLLDVQLADHLVDIGRKEGFEMAKGKTITTQCFYEGQGRLDGAICEHTMEDKISYLTQLKDNGVVNMEMEAVAFAALTHHSGIRSAIICVALLDRLKGDQITTPKEELAVWQERPWRVVSRFIRETLSKDQIRAAAPTIKKTNSNSA